MEKEKKQPIIYLTTHELMERWKCAYQTAFEFAHSKYSKAIKPSKRLLIPLKAIEAYERTRVVVL